MSYYKPRGQKRQGKCFNCGKEGHWAKTCFAKKKSSGYGRRY